MKKVLYIAPEYPGLGENAAQVRANALLPRLSQRLDLRVLAFPVDGAGDVMCCMSNVSKVNRHEMKAYDYFLGTLSTRPRAFRRFDTPAARSTLARILREFEPEIVHFDSIATLGLIDVVMKLPRRPKIVAQTHDAVSQLYKRRIKGAGIFSKLNIWNEYRKILQGEASVLGKVDLIIVDSDEDAAFLARQSGGTDVETLPLGFDPDVFMPDGVKASLQTPSIVFSGAMSGDQSIDAAVFLVKEIMPQVWKKYPDCQVYLVGNKPSQEVQALKSGRVDVTGFVDNLASYLRASNLYVCPLRMGSGMRTRVIEALACGALVLATPFAMRGIERCPDGKIPWLEAESAAQFVLLINENLTRDNSTRRAAAAAYASRSYSWDSVADRLCQIYREM